MRIRSVTTVKRPVPLVRPLASTLRTIVSPSKRPSPSLCRRAVATGSGEPARVLSPRWGVGSTSGALSSGAEPKEISTVIVVMLLQRDTGWLRHHSFPPSGNRHDAEAVYGPERMQKQYTGRSDCG